MPIPEVQPLTTLHNALEAAQQKYSETIEQAKLDRDNTVKTAQAQYDQDLKAYNAAVADEARKRG